MINPSPQLKVSQRKSFAQAFSKACRVKRHRPYREQYLKEDSDTSPDSINKIMARSWADEFRASYTAAKNAPNLSDEDKYLLIRDSLSRAEEAGVSIKYNELIRRILYG